MKAKDIIEMYEKIKKEYGKDAFKYISSIFKEAKEIHRKDFLKSDTAKKAIAEGRQPDHEQSWKPFKGNALEKLIAYILKDEIISLGLKIISGKKIERTNPENLTFELKNVKKNLAIDFGEFGYHLPDVDIIIYNPLNYKVLAILSSKTTLRERIAQTGYWNYKIKNDELTKHIKVYFITPDEDKIFSLKFPAKKERAIVEIDSDGGYILSESNIQESNKVKTFDKFIDDLKELLK